MNPAPNLFVVLQQVERSMWCVVRRRVQDGKPTFASRVATARPYSEACRAALDTAKAENLRVAVQATGAELRRFDPQRDVREPRL